MKMNFLRRLALLCAVLTCGMLLALPAAAAEADAPYAEDGDMDYIRSYVVTVDPREDGSVDITYDIDWQVIDGDKTDYLSWVKIGLANSSVDELTPLTDTIYDLRFTVHERRRQLRQGRVPSPLLRARCGRRQRRGEQRTFCIQRAPKPFVHKKR